MVRTVDSPAPRALKVINGDDQQADDITLTGSEYYRERRCLDRYLAS